MKKCNQLTPFKGLTSSSAAT